MKIILHFMQAVCKGWYFCKYHEKWKRRAKVGSETLENVAINRIMTNVKHNILSNYYFYMLQFSESCDKNADSAPALLPTFAMKNHSVLRWHDPDTEKIRTFCDFDCRDKKRHNGKLCDIRMKCNVVIHIQNPMLRTE